MRAVISIVTLFLIPFMCCQKSTEKTVLYESNLLKIEQLTQNTFIHISYLKTESYGKVPCNGLVFIDNDEAVVFDAPTNNEASSELIKWISETLKSKVKAIVINHYHVDCLGGLEEFHRQNIPSHTYNLTIKLAKENQKEVPEVGFENPEIIKIGNKKIINTYFGEAHAKDNIVSYIPSEKVLFGGCAIKSINAKKGNLNDANVDQWSDTVLLIKETYPNLKYVVPGHGKTGGNELLDYTITLFKQ